MTTPHLLHPDYQAALESMPRAPDGTVKSLEYIPPNQLAAYEKAWGEWCRKNDPKVYPEWLHRWIKKRKAEKRASQSDSTQELV